MAKRNGTEGLGDDRAFTDKDNCVVFNREIRPEEKNRSVGLAAVAKCGYREEREDGFFYCNDPAQDEEKFSCVPAARLLSLPQNAVYREEGAAVPVGLGRTESLVIRSPGSPRKGR